MEQQVAAKHQCCTFTVRNKRRNLFFANLRYIFFSSVGVGAHSKCALKKPTGRRRLICTLLYPLSIFPFVFRSLCSFASLRLHSDVTLTLSQTVGLSISPSPLSPSAVPLLCHLSFHNPPSPPPLFFPFRLLPVSPLPRLPIFLYSTCVSIWMEWLSTLRRCRDGWLAEGRRDGGPKGQMHQARDSGGEMERHLMFSRWGSHECSYNL